MFLKLFWIHISIKYEIQTNKIQKYDYANNLVRWMRVSREKVNKAQRKVAVREQRSEHICSKRFSCSE
jgi:hypothetical protein